VQAASRRQSLTPDGMRRRIQNTLDELAELRDDTKGLVEVRVAPFVPQIGINVVDMGMPSGLIMIQHYEHRPNAEAAPVFLINATDGIWYSHFAAEAERMWQDGISWPLSADQALKTYHRPAFLDVFGRDAERAWAESQDLIITGVARNTLVTSNYNRFEVLLSRGAKIRFLLIDPDSGAVTTTADGYYAERSPDTVRQRILQTLRLLSELKRATGGDISVRLTSYPLAVGLIGADAAPGSRSDSSVLLVECYSYQAQGEPKFILQPSDGRWFEHFLGEAEALWSSAKESGLG
jgi:hypothetical protein